MYNASYICLQKRMVRSRQTHRSACPRPLLGIARRLNVIPAVVQRAAPWSFTSR